MCDGECRRDLAQDDLCLLIDRVAELERELANAQQYLEACRELIGARAGELLIDAIRRQPGAQPQNVADRPKDTRLR